MANLFLIGRIIFGGFFVYQAYNHFKNHGGLTQYAQSKKLPMASVMVYISGALMLLGGVSIVANIYPLLGMWLLVLFLVPTTFMMHAFWKETDGQARMSEMSAFLKNFALIGALCMLIALSTVILGA